MQDMAQQQEEYSQDVLSQQVKALGAGAEGRLSTFARHRSSNSSTSTASSGKTVFSA